jgi:hypothetical protein
MSYPNGWAAIQLEMPARIPRTECSAESHWDLIQAVIGIEVGVDSSDEVKSQASAAFTRAWNYDLISARWTRVVPALACLRTRARMPFWIESSIDATLCEEGMPC